MFTPIDINQSFSFNINPTFSRDRTLHQHLINYISTSLATGKYDRIPSFYAPHSRDVKRLVELWNTIYREHYLEIQERFRSGRTITPNVSMEDTLGGLRVHSLNLRDDPHVNVHAYELFSLLPTSLRPPKEALIPSSSYRLTTKIDEEVQKLCKWFKEGYMKWVDPILCSRCSSPTKGIGSSEPTPGEREDGANRVELHQCQAQNCGEANRFCRFSKVKALIRDRRGRCGEWAQLFYCFLRLKGVESRYIWNSEDHVWCEYWSPTLQHWVHVDPCEAATNKPLLYARGWGKKQAFCLAFGACGAEDVTRAYVDDWEECKVRRRAKGWKELDLRRALFAHTVAIRLRLPPNERIRLEAMDNLQSLWMADERGRLAESERGELSGRISGPEDWRAMRDELGLGDKAVEKPNFKVNKSLAAHQDQLFKFGNTRILNDPTNSGSILLTDGPSQTSSIFQPNPIDQNADFRCSFKFKLTSPGSGEADGIALIFVKDSKSGSGMGLGLGGYGLGYDGLGGEGDFVIEIDTYRTQDYANDPPTPHISIHSPPKAHHQCSLGCTKPGSIPFLSDGRVYELEVIHQYRLDRDPESKRRIRGYLQTPDGDELEVIDVELPSSKTRIIEDGEDGREQDKKNENENENGNDNWWIGISGSCGGLWQRQEILDWQIDLIEFDQAKDTEGHTVIDEKEKEKEVEIERDEV